MNHRMASRREISLNAGAKDFSTRLVVSECWNQKNKLLPAQWVQGSDPPSNLLPARRDAPPPAPAPPAAS